MKEAQDTYWMQEALKVAQLAATQGEVPVGAVLVDTKGICLAVGHNQPIALSDPSAHAEIVALREAGKKFGNYRLLGTTLYVTLEPCSMCAGAILHARVQRLVFGAFDPKCGACGSILQALQYKGATHNIQLTTGVLAEECGALLRDFFKARRT